MDKFIIGGLISIVTLFTTAASLTIIKTPKKESN